jgi:hypothetical protein
MATVIGQRTHFDITRDIAKGGEGDSRVGTVQGGERAMPHALAVAIVRGRPRD